MARQKRDVTDGDEIITEAKGEELVLTFLFGVLLAGVLTVLYLDFRALTGSDLSFDLPFLKPAERIAPIRPPEQDDQVRRYSPQTRVDFGPSGKAKMPGYAGNPDTLLSGSMTFYRAKDGVISAIGLIDIGTFLQFEDFILKSPEDNKPKTIFLHSPGGSVRDALQMARFIRESGFNTHIVKHGYCASSCPLVFSGGVQRVVKKPAALGVHQVSISDSAIGTLQQGIANAQAISAEAQQLLVDMGVDPKAWIQAMATDKDKLYLFTEKEIETLKWRTKK